MIEGAPEIRTTNNQADLSADLVSLAPPES